MGWQVVRTLLLFMTLASAAVADEAGLQKSLARAQFMLRQATAEKTTLQQQVTDLQKQVESLQGQLVETRAVAGSRSEALAKKLAVAEASARESREKLSGDLRSTQQSVKLEKQEKVALQQELQRQTDNFALCYENNRKLYDVNRELLGKYNDKGAMDALLQREPFTGRGAVEIENLIQDYQYKIDDLKLPDVDAEVSSAAMGDSSSMSGGRAASAP